MTIFYTFGERQLQRIEDVLQSQHSHNVHRNQPAVAGPLIQAHPQSEVWIKSHSLTSDAAVSTHSTSKLTRQVDVFLPNDPRVPSSWITPEPIIHEVTDIPADKTGLLLRAGCGVSEHTEASKDIPNEILKIDLGLGDIDDTALKALIELGSLLDSDYQENIIGEASPRDNPRPFQTLGNENEAQVTFRGHDSTRSNNSSKVANVIDLQTILLTPSGGLSTGGKGFRDFVSHNSPTTLNIHTVVGREFGIRPGTLSDTTGNTAEEDQHLKKIHGQFNLENDYQKLNTFGDKPNIAIHNSMDLSMKSHLGLRDISSPSGSSSSSNDGDSEASSRKRAKRSGSDDDQREKNNTSSRKSREKKARNEKDNEVKCKALEDEHDNLIHESGILREKIEELHRYHSCLLQQVRQRLWSVF